MVVVPQAGDDEAGRLLPAREGVRVAFGVCRIVREREAVIRLDEDERRRRRRSVLRCHADRPIGEHLGVEHRVAAVSVPELLVVVGGVDREAEERERDDRRRRTKRGGLGAREEPDGERDERVLDGEDIGEEARAAAGVIAVEIERGVGDDDRRHQPEAGADRR